LFTYLFKNNFTRIIFSWCLAALVLAYPFFLLAKSHAEGENRTKQRNFETGLVINEIWTKIDKPVPVTKDSPPLDRLTSSIRSYMDLTQQVAATKVPAQLELTEPDGYQQVSDEVRDYCFQTAERNEKMVFAGFSSDFVDDWKTYNKKGLPGVLRTSTPPIPVDSYQATLPILQYTIPIAGAGVVLAVLWSGLFTLAVFLTPAQRRIRKYRQTIVHLRNKLANYSRDDPLHQEACEAIEACEEAIRVIEAQPSRTRTERKELREQMEREYFATKVSEVKEEANLEKITEGAREEVRRLRT
jgi:hypothetical protein